MKKIAKKNRKIMDIQNLVEAQRNQQMDIELKNINSRNKDLQRRMTFFPNKNQSYLLMDQL